MLRKMLLLGLCLWCSAQAAPRTTVPSGHLQATLQCAPTSKPVGLSQVKFSGLSALSSVSVPQKVSQGEGFCTVQQKAVVFRRFLPLDQVLKALKPRVVPVLKWLKQNGQDRQ